MTFRASRISLLVIVVLALSTISGNGQQTSTRYDYHQSTEALIYSGMKRYNPALRVDQEAEYVTSVHGRKIAQGDQKPATCISCHASPI